MDALSHFAKDDPSCPFCTSVDGKEHRVFHCNGLHDLRCKYKSTINWVKTQPKAVLHFGLVPDNNDAVLLRQREFAQGFQYVLPSQGSDAVVYTDGTCFNNTSWEHAIAGAAVIEVTGEYQWKLVRREVLPTPDHSAYRGECFAVVLALQSFWKVSIHSDCEAVCDELERMLRCRAEGLPLVNSSHPDVWNVIAWHLQQRPPGVVHVKKVKAHVEWKALPEGFAKHAAYYNSMVDLEAKKSVAADHFQLWQKFEEMLDSKKAVMRGVRDYHNFLWEMCERSFAAKPRQQPLNVQPDFSTLWDLSGPRVEVQCPLAQDLECCPFAAKFATLVSQWWCRLEWFQAPPVTLLELYFRFCYQMGAQVPVRLSDNTYKMRCDSVLADVSTQRLGQQLHVWLKFLRWWLERIQHPSLQALSSGAAFAAAFARTGRSPESCAGVVAFLASLLAAGFMSLIWCFMSVRCHKCKQADPHLGDSWCLACSAVEELSGELRSAWGSPGSRAVAADVLVSATRQVRALRRLGLAGGGRVKPAEPGEAGTSRASSQPAAEGRAPAAPAPPAPPAEKRGAPVESTVKTEEPPKEVDTKDKAASSSGEDESGEEEEEEEDPPESSGLKVLPKAKPDPRPDARESLPRRRSSDYVDRSRRADYGRASEADYRREHRSPHRRSERDRRDRSRSRRREPPREEKPKKKRKRHRKNHRAGTKHKRHERAQQDPYRRLHYRKPDDFWDNPPSLR
eukprot:s557_g6.t1